MFQIMTKIHIVLGFQIEQYTRKSIYVGSTIYSVYALEKNNNRYLFRPT